MQDNIRMDANCPNRETRDDANPIYHPDPTTNAEDKTLQSQFHFLFADYTSYIIMLKLIELSKYNQITTF
jgi:hypothetical protein